MSRQFQRPFLYKIRHNNIHRRTPLRHTQHLCSLPQSPNWIGEIISWVQQLWQFSFESHKIVKIMAIVSGGVMFGVISLARVWQIFLDGVYAYISDIEISSATSQTTIILGL